MTSKLLSIRPFIGAADFDTSRNFYTDLGFNETIISPDFSVFEYEQIAFYLQKAYVKDWIDNTMIFLEVNDVKEYWENLMKLDLSSKYSNVRLIPVKEHHWGSECFIHDPSGILWHVGEFNR